MLNYREPRKIGELLLQRRLITEQQLQSAIAQQALSPQPLGEILIQQQAITARQLQRVLKWQQMLHAAMLISSFTLASSPCAASEAQRLTKQLVDNLPGYAQASSQRHTRSTAENHSEASWISNLRRGPAAPVVTLVAGEYAGGVNRASKGLRYKANWSGSGVKLELRYQY
jgi:hypothetical protein